MYTFKKKLITHACALSFLAASVGSGFGAWIFTNKNSTDNLNPTTVLTDAIVLTDYITPKLETSNLIIDDSGNDMEGIEIRLTSYLKGVSGETISADVENAAENTKFALLYSLQCEVLPIDSGADCLNKYIGLNSVGAMTTKTTDGDVKDDSTGHITTFGTVTDPLQFVSSNSATDDNTYPTTDSKGNQTYSNIYYKGTDGKVTLRHNFTKTSANENYAMDVCVFPKFAYTESQLTDIDSYKTLRAAILNTKLVFTFDIVDVIIVN